MTATVHLSNGTHISFDAIAGIKRTTTRGILVTLEGANQGETQTCALIPADRVGAVIESLQLVARSLQQQP